MDSGWFGLVLSKSYPTATPMQCSLENLGISWISKHQTYGWKHVSNLRYTEFLAAVPWNATIILRCSGKSSYCKTHMAVSVNEATFGGTYFSISMRGRMKEVVLFYCWLDMMGYRWTCTFFPWPLVHSDCLVFCHPIDVFSFSLWLFLALLFFLPIIKT